MAIKSRNFVARKSNGFARLEDGSVYNSEWSVQAYESQTTESFTNPDYRLLGKAPWDIGGPFMTEREYYILPSDFSMAKPWKPDSPLIAYAQGLQLPMPLGEMHPPPLTPVFPGDLDAKGSTAIARVLPTNPHAGFAQFVGELRRDGVPRLVGAGLLKARVGHFRELGGEYLNAQFGWKPFVSDLRKFSQSIMESERILKTFHANSGKNMKRQYVFPVVEELNVVDLGSATAFPSIGVGGEQPFFYTGSGDGRLLVTSRRREFKWFEGCFTYSAPAVVNDTVLDRFKGWAADAEHLFGMNLTPETLYNITPWTWMADWFGNTGDILHNLSRFSQDHLVMRYGYMMQHELCERTYTLSGILRKDGVNELSVTAVNERKRRVPATPYGFGLLWDGFSPYQLSILAALGISRKSYHP